MESLSAPIGRRDYHVIIDKSGTMSTSDVEPNSPKTRWTYMKESLLALVSKVTQLDPDGISVYVFSGRFKTYHNVSSVQIVENIYRENEPMGGTKLAPVLQAALTNYFTTRGTPGKFGATILVVTDGAADDREEVIREIVTAANATQTKEELGITFVQIGHDTDATKFLKFLDDNLGERGARKDIVTTVKIDDFEERTLTEVLWESITK